MPLGATGAVGWGEAGGGGSHLASVVVDDKAGTPAVEVLVGTHGALQLLQQRLVGATARGVHGGAHVVQDTHDARGALRSWGVAVAQPRPTLPKSHYRDLHWDEGGGALPNIRAKGGGGAQICVCGLLWKLPGVQEG